MLSIFVSCFTYNHVVNFAIITTCSCRCRLNPNIISWVLETINLDLHLYFCMLCYYLCFCAFSHYLLPPPSLACDSVSKMGLIFPRSFASLFPWFLHWLKFEGEKNKAQGMHSHPCSSREVSHSMSACKSAGPVDQGCSPRRNRQSGLGNGCQLSARCCASSAEFPVILSGPKRFSWLVTTLTLCSFRVFAFKEG